MIDIVAIGFGTGSIAGGISGSSLIWYLTKKYWDKVDCLDRKFTQLIDVLCLTDRKFNENWHKLSNRRTKDV